MPEAELPAVPAYFNPRTAVVVCPVVVVESPTPVFANSASRVPEQQPFDEEGDAQRASAVKATIHRLGLTVTQAATEAGAVYQHAAGWLRRENTHRPPVRAAAPKLWAWHQTAQHRSPPEQPEPFEEETDAQRAAAVKATVAEQGTGSEGSGLQRFGECGWQLVAA